MPIALIETAIKSILAGTAAVTAITNRIYMGRMPDNTTFPAVSFQRITTTKPQTLTGRVSLRNSLVQVDSWSRASSVESLRLGAEVFLALEGYRGIAAGVDVQGILLDDEELIPSEPDLEVSRVRQIYRVQYQEE